MYRYCLPGNSSCSLAASVKIHHYILKDSTRTTVHYVMVRYLFRRSIMHHHHHHHQNLMNTTAHACILPSAIRTIQVPGYLVPGTCEELCTESYVFSTRGAKIVTKLVPCSRPRSRGVSCIVYCIFQTKQRPFTFTF